MEITLGQYDDIQQYLDGKMEPEQAASFLQELRANKDLTEAFEFEKSVRENAQGIRQAREILAVTQALTQNAADDPAADTDVRNLIQQSGREWSQTRTTPPLPQASAPPMTATAKVIPFRWTKMAIAASLLIATGSIVFLYIYKNRIEQPAALFAEYFSKDPVPEGDHPMLAQALTDYTHNNYTTLKRYDLDNLPTLKGGGEDQRQKILELGYYYKGIAFLASGEADSATPAFQWVIDHAVTDSLVWKAQWYEALAELKSSNIPAAISMLRPVSSNPKAGTYREQAIALLNKLSKETH